VQSAALELVASGQERAGGAAGFLRGTTPKQFSKIVTNTLAPIRHAPTRVPRSMTDPLPHFS
jgi:hypothetical protein